VIRVAHPTRAPLSTSGDAPLLALRGVRVRYGAIEAVRGIDLTVRSGEIVALIGANGAGKTTTLSSIAGLLPLAGGTAHFAGRDLAGASPEERAAWGISLVPEGRAIFPNLTVRENLDLGAYVHRDARAMKEGLADVTALFPRLGERMRQLGGTLSGGEQQMLAIGRALMARPLLLLLDEPSLGIAPLLVTAIFEAIVAIARAGVTVLLVEQNTRLALSTSQRAYVLSTGEIALDGASSDLAQSDAVRAAYLGV
jgi:branched-chain amino acid transport system ATP-binding protein